MSLSLLQDRYRISIPRSVWPEFLVRLTDDYRGRLIVLKILDYQMGHFEVLAHEPLHSVVYEPPDHGNRLIVTVSRASSPREQRYSHIVGFPQTLEIVTDADGAIEQCIVTDDDHAQTIIRIKN